MPDDQELDDERGQQAEVGEKPDLRIAGDEEALVSRSRGKTIGVMTAAASVSAWKSDAESRIFFFMAFGRIL